MWKLKAMVLGPLLAMALGCAGNPGKQSFVLIGLERDPDCTTVSDVQVTGASKAEVKEKLKEEAANRKANYVHLRNLTRNQDTHQYTARGSACLCR